MDLRLKKIKSIAEEMSKEGIINSNQLLEIVEKNQNSGEDLADILVQKGYLSELDLNQRLAKKAGVTVASLSELNLDKKTLSLFNPDQALKWQAVPISQNGDTVTVGTNNPFDFMMLDEIRSEIGVNVNFALLSKRELKVLIDEHYNHLAPKLDSQKTKESSLNAVSLVDELLERAYDEKASDVHIEPTREAVQIRFRIDGFLESKATLPLNIHQSLLSRIKILGGMDVAEHRIPQDGRLRRHVSGKDLDIRIATYPTISGECAAIRLLSKENLLSLEDMGFSKEERDTFKEIIQSPHGIFLVTGPTGSGKTTTLYTALNNIDRLTKHVLTVEDPVENEIDLASQTQVNNRAGLTFASVLRSMLREDPDVIMVGEIRDQETAEISCRAAMTGHLVLSTLHTNTAIGAISRLQDLGLKPYLISATLTGVMAQRLVRKLCQACKTEAPVPTEYEALFSKQSVSLMKNYHSPGCSACKNKGFKGRIGLYELIPIDDELRVLINTGAPEVRLRERAQILGCKTLFEDGILKVSNGLTSIEEVFRVCGEIL